MERLRTMIKKNNCKLPSEYLEELAKQGLDGLPDLMRVLVNEAMRIERYYHLNANPYERTEESQGYANGIKPKTVKNRLVN